MRIFLSIILTILIFSGCAGVEKPKTEIVKAKPVYPKYDGKFPAVLSIVPLGNKLVINIGNPYKTSFSIIMSEEDFTVYNKNIVHYNITEPGIHEIVLWQPSGDYLLYSFDNETPQALCCYDKGYDEIKLYNPAEVKIIDNVMFFGELIKNGSKKKKYLACIVNDIELAHRIKSAGNKYYQK